MRPVLVREVLGQVLREVRLSQQRTLRDVSVTARVSLGYLSEVERGQKEASSELLHAICQALGVSQAQIALRLAQKLAGAEEPTLTAVAA